LLALLLAPAGAGAAVSCNFTSTPGMAFGVYDDSSATPDDSATSVVARCWRIGGPASAAVVLQIGASATSGLIATRQMASGAERLDYNLYRDAGRTLVWGQTIGTNTVTVNLTGIPNFGSRNATFTIYGRIPALQNVGAGAYVDSVVITVTP
jgi:spore coat protein U-like protein